MENIKLSYIVPVYNVELYLQKCVNSLIHQDISDYEIILIDDGSTDNSGKICDELGETIRDERLAIKVIHQKNGGLSAARNAGLKVAKGEYIMFVDSDDYLEPNVLGKLVRMMNEKQLDVLRYNFHNVRIVNAEALIVSIDEWKYEVFEPFRAAKRDVDYSELVTDGETFLNERLGPMCYAVMFVIKRDIIISNQHSDISNQTSKKEDCLFKEGIYFEDVEWTPRMLLRAKRVASTPMVVYNYFWRVGSISLAVAPEKLRKTVEDKIGLIRGFQEQRKMVNDPIWFDWMTSFTAMTILDVLTNLSSKECRAYVRELQSLEIFPLITKKEKIQSHKIKIHVVNISPLLYCKLIKIVKHVKGKK